MSYTKGEIVSQALNEIGIADYEFDISPEELTSGTRRLDAMISMWADKGVRLSYPIGGGYEEDSYLPNVALEAVITNLAIRLAPSYGKQVAPDVAANAKIALSSLMRYSAHPREQQMRTMPRGAGYKGTNSVFTPPPVDRYLEGIDNDVDISGGPDGT